MRSVVRVITVVLLALAVASCSKVTVDNYNKLKTGMTYSEVERILGAPSKCSDVLTVRSCIWGDDKRHITVNFVADQAILYTSENIR
jgi:acid phosphatase class B